MEFHIGELNSEIEIGEAAPGVAPAQIEQIVRLVIERLDARERARMRRAETSAIDPNLLPRLPWE
jgi:hypothetical protein